MFKHVTSMVTMIIIMQYDHLSKVALPKTFTKNKFHANYIGARQLAFHIEYSLSQRKSSSLWKDISVKVVENCKKMYLLELVHRDWILMQQNTLQSFAFL